jgi:hypothetical protein
MYLLLSQTYSAISQPRFKVMHRPFTRFLEYFPSRDVLPPLGQLEIETCFAFRATS